MKHRNIITFAALALSSLVAITVLAQNAHFMRCSSSVNSSTGCISASFRIAGLGAGASDIITAHTTATATWGCLNHGQQCPNAANKFTASQELSGSLTVRAGHNGSATGSINLCPAQPTTFSCPGGQTLVLISVTYSDVTLSNDQNDDTCITSGGTFSQYPQCP